MSYHPRRSTLTSYAEHPSSTVDPDGLYEIDLHDVDIESQTPKPPPQPERAPRFTYEPSSLKNRMLVAFCMKNKLDSSRIVHVEYRVQFKYGLVLTLLLIAAFLTPRLLPRWLGFEWARPQDLCRNPAQKIEELTARVQNLTNIHEAERFLINQKETMKCMNKSASDFFYGFKGTPPRWEWPHMCSKEVRKVSLKEQTCVSQEVNVCSTAGGFGGFLLNIFGQCKKEVGPPVCVETTDANRTQALLELEHQRDLLHKVNNTVEQSDPVVETANEKVQAMISRIITQVDIAANIFIVYSLLSIIIGVPLVVYKREKGSRIVGATFGLTKMAFVLIVVVLLTLYDSVAVVMKETDFTRLYQNFLNDPCYVNPEFSRKRVQLIIEGCNNVTAIDQESDIVLQKMDGLYYDVRLFGYCEDLLRGKATHPRLVAMDYIRGQYRNGTVSSPGQCNTTYLDEQTSIAPQNKKVSKLRTFLGSGVVAQLMLKFIVSGWILHLVAYLEPMALHNGKVEVWGTHEGSDLSKEEENAVSNFAKDKHLLPLVGFSILLILEVVLVIYGIVTSVSGADQIQIHVNATAELTETVNFTCPTSLRV